jgi:hypothetical protein
MTDKDYVYISYSRYNSLFVDRLATDLRRAGVKVWRDVEQITPGSNWAEETARALRGSSALLWIISKQSLQSEALKKEITYFHSTGASIIPLFLGDATLDDLPPIFQYYFAGLQYITFQGDYNKAVEALRVALAPIVPQGPPIAPNTKRSKGYVFISYAREDADFTILLKDFLKEHGYAYWDYDESDRDYHNQLFRELEGVIREAMATLSILSEAWKQSQWTIREYFFSNEVGTPVFLLRAKEVGPILAIAGMPYIDFVGDSQRGFDKLHRELTRKSL